MQINWNDIDTVLLDMDGTLLDRHFDDHFWLEHAPRRWAARNGTTLEHAKEHLYALFRSQENTLNWTDLDYWSDRLGMDIPLLKQEVQHLIAVHPFVVEFLLFLRQHGKHAWLVTNAHSKTLDLKMKRTSLGPYFDGIISAHQVGLPKEDLGFWDALQRFVAYDPARTMLGEDSETNLGTAAAYGIRYLIYVGRYSSSITPQNSERYATIHYFSQLIPPDGSMTASLQPDAIVPMTLLRTFILLLLAATAVHAVENELHLGRFSTGDLNGWKEQSVSLFKAKTAYTLAKDNDRSVLVAHSSKSASGQIYKVTLDPKEYQTLKWSWKIDHTIKKGNEKIKEGDDFAARVYVIFPRGLFSSTRAICYVWANKLPKGEHVVSPFTPNIITVAADSGPDLAGRWTFHQQNIYEDYRRFFGEEPPKIGGVAVMTDTDNTGESAVGYYGDISLVRTVRSGEEKKKEGKSKEAIGKESKPRDPIIKDTPTKDQKQKEPVGKETVPPDQKQNEGTAPVGPVPPAPPSIPAKPAAVSSPPTAGN